MKKAAWMALGWLVLHCSAHAASFDCAKAQTKVEKLICVDPELSKLDDELAAAYTTALRDRRKSDAIRDAQKQWMKERNGCSDAGCVKLAYTNRLPAFIGNLVGRNQKFENGTLAQSGAALAICPEIKTMLQKSTYSEGSIEMLLVESIDDPLSGHKYLNLDIDGDGQFDDVRGGCSVSSEPADGCILDYRFASDGKTISHQFPSDQRFFLISYKKKIFAISSEIRPKDQKHARYVYELTTTGLNAVCR